MRNGGVRMGIVAVALLAAPGLAKAQQAREPVQVTEAALAIHRKANLVDGHNDLPWQVREKAKSSFGGLDLRRPQKELHTDIPRLRQGNVGTQFWSAYIPSEYIHSGGAARYCLEQIDLIHRMCDEYPDVFEMAYTIEDVRRIRAEGKIASLIGIEGGHAIEGSLGALRMFHRLGARYMTLTHSETHDWADSATDEPKHGGLSPFGEEVVREMNRLGMLVDISHVSPDTMRDVLRVSSAPVIASHSSAYAVAEHPRNVPDDVLKRIAENNGVVMVNFFSGFIVPEGARAMQQMFEVRRRLQKQYDDETQLQLALDQWRRENPYPAGTVHHLVDHIDHIVKVAGVDHVGLGSDYDGVVKLPAQLEDVSTYPVVTQELLNRGYNEEQILKILGGNALRVIEQAQRVAGR